MREVDRFARFAQPANFTQDQSSLDKGNCQANPRSIMGTGLGGSGPVPCRRPCCTGCLHSCKIRVRAWICCFCSRPQHVVVATKQHCCCIICLAPEAGVPRRRRRRRRRCCHSPHAGPRLCRTPRQISQGFCSTHPSQPPQVALPNLQPNRRAAACAPTAMRARRGSVPRTERVPLAGHPQRAPHKVGVQGGGRGYPPGAGSHVRPGEPERRTRARTSCKLVPAVRPPTHPPTLPILPNPARPRAAVQGGGQLFQRGWRFG